jgi:hypothetical protein
MAGETVVVQGLAEMQRTLRGAGPQLGRLLGRAHKTIAERYVAAPARTLGASLGRGHVHLARAGVISGRGTAKDATIRLNAAGRYPDAMAQEFGALTGHIFSKKKTPNIYGQFPAWRGNASETTWMEGTDGAGYALFPTIRANRQRIMNEYLDVIDQTFREVFPG